VRQVEKNSTVAAAPTCSVAGRSASPRGPVSQVPSGWLCDSLDSRATRPDLTVPGPLGERAGERGLRRVAGSALGRYFVAPFQGSRYAR
jgi:hypothetical protein